MSDQSDAIREFRSAVAADKGIEARFRAAFPELASALLDREGELSAKELSEMAADIATPTDLS